MSLASTSISSSPSIHIAPLTLLHQYSREFSVHLGFRGFRVSGGLPVVCTFFFRVVCAFAVRVLGF